MELEDSINIRKRIGNGLLVANEPILCDRIQNEMKINDLNK